jgi:hypothetical protein
LGNFFGGREGIWSEIEGFAGSLKVPGILGSFVAAVHPRRRKIIASKSGGSRAGGDSKPAEQKAPRIPDTFDNPEKIPWTSLVFQFLKIGPSSRVGLAENVQSTHWKKNPNPRNDSSIFHSSPVQEQSKPHKILQKPTANQCFSQKTLESILEKFQSKLACFSEISAGKKLDSPG